MVIYQGRQGRTETGKKYKMHSKKEKARMGRPPILTKIDDKLLKKQRVRGNNLKIKIKSTDTVNVLLGNKTYKKAKILALVDNKANPKLLKNKIITKGAIVKTDMGNVKITSRPGQQPVLNGVLLEAKNE
ncbi:MAG: 30S ribosomal protein S8e [Euryarchaeota archaeon HGW-Euryarchaeota-1]|nr:MAG: 30S ribosomal protein S8e [Euryarchaeota archaeon HGW-Euryarchaeota-1]